jgi:hypothetical protein
MEEVKGEIYRITNRINEHVYIGQTLTHRKNRGKYKPFGYIGRFKDHVSEAICNTKKKQCWYLNSAIRKYGAEYFEVNLIEQCDIPDLDTREVFYIAQYKSMYPNGYNLTAGGKTTRNIQIERDTPLSEFGKRGGCEFRSEETRTRISRGIQEALASSSVKEQMSQRTRQQHLANKIAKFKDIQLDEKKLDQYIHIQSKRVVIKLNTQKITFASKHSTSEERYTQAKNFLLQICNTSKLTGTPLEF